MSNEALERYVELKKQISGLEKELDELKDEVFSAVDKDGGEFVQDAYTVRSYKTPKYKYSADYDTKNNELKELRKAEVENGTAVIDGYSEFVKITFKKEKKVKEKKEKKSKD